MERQRVSYASRLFPGSELVHPAVTTPSAREQVQYPLRAELSHHRLGHLVRVELATIGELQNPDRDDLDNGSRPRQPHLGARLLECAVHCVDLVNSEGWSRTAPIRRFFAQMRNFPALLAR
jgi:hypothetical protein